LLEIFPRRRERERERDDVIRVEERGEGRGDTGENPLVPVIIHSGTKPTQPGGEETIEIEAT
jgi:hypothetical protein